MNWKNVTVLVKSEGYTGDVNDKDAVKAFLKSKGYSDTIINDGENDHLIDELFENREIAPLKANKALKVAVGKDRAEDDPKLFKNINDYLESVILLSTRKNLDPAKKSYLMRKAAGSDEQGVYDAGFGGFLVPTTLLPGVMQVNPEADPTAGRVTRVPMNSPNIRINARVDKNHTSSVSGGLTVSRKNETAAGSSSRMEFEQISLNANMLFGLSYATRELLDDSPSSVAALLAQGFGQEFASHILSEKITGNGVGQYQGVLNSPALVTVTRNTGSDIKYADIVGMRARCWGYNNAIWLANHDTMSKLMTMVDAGNNLVWQPSAREDKPDLILGRPVFFTEYAKTLGTSGDLILGNWSQYLEGNYQGLQSESSIHVRFVEHENAFKFTQRNDGKVWWTSALTPKNSATTLSPFIVLS